MSGDGDHIAIDYEFIEESANGPETTEEIADFLSLGGFTFTNYPEDRNWKSGVFVDLSEIVHVRGDGWKEKDFSLLQQTSALTVLLRGVQ